MGDLWRGSSDVRRVCTRRVRLFVKRGVFGRGWDPKGRDLLPGVGDTVGLVFETSREGVLTGIGLDTTVVYESLVGKEK